MAKLAYLDATAGASGDMVLGALLDLGLPLDALRSELRKLPLEGYRLEAAKVRRAGIQATKLDVVVEGHSHGHSHGHARGLRDILALLERSGLEPPVRGRAAQLFRRLAEAEATVHGQTPEDVHFHEVGAVDSIVDVVGAVIGLSWLAADRLVASPLNVGGGTVTMAHGRASVPAPATALLVRGAPAFGEGDFERLTPTGALLVTGYAESYGPLPPMRIEAVGCGAGARESAERANVFRILAGSAESAGEERILVLECEVDDMSPQLLGPLVERLLGQGALDAYLTPIHMKKGRPGILIGVLAAPERRDAIEELLFSETTTLGVRHQEWRRSVLERERVEVETPYGRIGVKVGRRGGRVYNAQPEFEDCQRVALERGVAVKEVWAAALTAWRAARG
jgi:uncharacterized protein (TIGR00299 family) protein